MCTVYTKFKKIRSDIQQPQIRVRIGNLVVCSNSQVMYAHWRHWAPVTVRKSTLFFAIEIAISGSSLEYKMLIAHNYRQRWFAHGRWAVATQSAIVAHGPVPYPSPVVRSISRVKFFEVFVGPVNLELAQIIGYCIVQSSKTPRKSFEFQPGYLPTTLYSLLASHCVTYTFAITPVA